MTGNVLLPHSLDSRTFDLDDSGRWDSFLSAQYGDLINQIEDLSGKSLGSRKTGYLQTLSTNVWTDSKQVLLLGDAAHGVFPFYGQGMNSALEDCLILDSLLGEMKEDFSKAFTRFEKERKVDTDALCELSREHFYELQGKRSQRSRFFSFFGSSSIYSLVAHTTRPYREALREWKRQERWQRILNWGAVPVALFLIIAILMHHSPSWAWMTSKTKKVSSISKIGDSQ